MARKPVKGDRPSAAPRRSTKRRPAAPAPSRRTRNAIAAAPCETERPLTIVGVGMSAGGLEACSQLLEALPPEPGVALVLIQHLAPHHRSALPALLAARTMVPVVEASDEIVVQVNHVYVIPPDVTLELVEGVLRLQPRSAEPGHNLPIDLFLASLAAVHGARAVAVILSGTGTDGAAGVLAIKARGGTVLVQEPGTAKYDGMPRAAIETGVVDLVLPPADIARQLVDLGAAPAMQPEPAPPDAQLTISDKEFDRIFELLREASGVDFAHYKQPTLRRRILRRMAMARVSDVQGYIRLLTERHDEARDLYQDILIHVTRFFREPESFQALAALALPGMLEGRGPENPVRIWVAGCSTGEEAYSLAITLLESAGDAAGVQSIQIFGTDVSEGAVDYARQGLYPLRIADDVPPDQLRRFFTRVDAGYRINKTVRDYCVFARQDLTRDPPFSKLDLIFCRNVLIYLDVVLQRKVIPILHYALKPDGYLVLGQSETIGPLSELFTCVDKKYKIYRRRAAERALPASLGYPMARRAVPQPAADRLTADARAAQNEANRAVLDLYGPPGVLVDENLEIVQFRGHTGPFLEPAPGDASLSLLKLAREGLLHALRSALQVARKTRKTVRKSALRIRSNGGWTDVDLEVIPLTALPSPHFLVLFDAPRGAAVRPVQPPHPAAPPVKGRKRTARLEEELAETREYLQSIVQDVEAANEELQSANEEILSSNEELQSTNEELDTAREELQSTNEELNTLNDELHARNEELTRVNSDLVNLLGSVQIAIVIVSTDLRIRRFTPMAEKMLNLIPPDVGRPLTQVKPNIDIGDLGQLILGVIDTVTPVEREVKDTEGHWFSLRIRPYKGLENRIDGAVIALLDIDTAKRHEIDIARARQYAETIVDTVREPVAVLDASLHVRSGNRAFCERFQMSQGRIEGRLIYDLGDGEPMRDLRPLLERLLQEKRVEDQEVVLRLAGNGPQTMVVNARLIEGTEPADAVIVVAFENESGRGR